MVKVFVGDRVNFIYFTAVQSWQKLTGALSYGKAQCLSGQMQFKVEDAYKYLRLFLHENNAIFILQSSQQC